MDFDGPAAVPPNRVSDEGSITVLHVDDDADLVELTATLLERENEALSVLTETSVDDALDRLEETAVDCVVSDYDMPGRDGLDFLRAVRERRPGLPFILFTGKGSEEIASEAISAGVTDYLRKGPGTDRYALLANRIENAATKHDAQRLVRRAYGAMDTAREGIALLDTEGYYQYVNQAYADITGYDRDELVGEHWEVMYPDCHADRVYDEILPAVPEVGRWSGETVYERKDGERILTSHALAYTDDETMICLVRERSGGADDLGALRRDRQQLDRFVDEVEEYAIVTLDSGGCITSWNEGAERLYGYASDEILGEHVSTLHTEAGRESGLPERLLATAREIGAAEDDGWMVRRDGTQFHSRVSITSVDEDGSHQGFVSVVHDHGMGTTDGLFVDALDALGDLFYVLDSEGTVVHVNERFRDVTGQTTAELASMDIADLFDPGDRDAVERGIRNALETGSDERELRLRAADGTVRTYGFSSHALTDEDGTPHRIVGIGRDVSDAKDRERALNELHRTTRALMRADSKEGIARLTTDALAEILTLTHAAVHLHYEREGALVPVAWTDYIAEVVGDPPDLGPGSLAWDVFHGGEAEYYPDLDDVDGLHNESTSLRSEFIVPLGDYGVALIASTEPTAFDENDRRLGQLLCENATAALERVTHEQTLRRRENELERENERLDEFASLVSHDLRNPLNVASGRLELASEECDSDHIGEARQALERMETLIGDVLSLARDGQTVETVESISLSTLVQRCWANVETGEADLNLVDDLTIRADESRLAQVFENLFRNSVEHGSMSSRPEADDSEASETPRTTGEAGDSVEHGSTDGPVQVTVGVIHGDDGDPEGFYVEDDGPGIPTAIRDRVFEGGYSTVETGTGFGLRIVSDIVEAHGWRIDLVDGDDGGARFEITGVDVA